MMPRPKQDGMETETGGVAEEISRGFFKNIIFILLLELQLRKAPPCSSSDTGRVVPLVVIVCL